MAWEQGSDMEVQRTKELSNEIIEMLRKERPYVVVAVLGGILVALHPATRDYLINAVTEFFRDRDSAKAGGNSTVPSADRA